MGHSNNPASVGVPVTWPLELLKARPAGSPVMLQLVRAETAVVAA